MTRSPHLHSLHVMGAVSLALVTLGVATLSLTGCAVKIIDRDAATASSFASTQPTASARPHTVSPPATEPGTTDPGTTGPGTTQDSILPLDRTAYASKVTKQLTCDNSAMTLDNIHGQVVEVTGPCTSLSIGSSAATVLIGEVGELIVDGVSTTVIATKIGKLTLTGSANVVVWDSGAPTVNDSGVSNVARSNRAGS